MKQITSADNAAFKALRRLMQSSHARREAGLSVLEGAHLVAAYLEHRGAPRQIVVSRTGMKNAEIGALLARAGGVAILELRDALFENLSSVVTPTGIMAIVETPRPSVVSADLGPCVMLEAIQDPGNLGSILRTCAAAGIRHALLSAATVNAWSPRVLRAGMGAHFAIAIYERVDLLAAVRRYPGRIIAARRGAGDTLFDADLTGNVGLLFGNEGAGLSPALLAAAPAVVSIPMPGKAESLNVAAAVAVCLFERVRQLSAASRR